MFPPKKKIMPKPGMKPGIMVPKKPMDDLESPDPVEGKALPDPEEEAAESPEEEGGEDYGAKFLADMTAPLISAGLDAAAARKTLAAQFRAGADCLDGSDGEDSGLDGSSAEMPSDDIAHS